LTASWDYFYGKLLAFLQRVGHLDVPHARTEDPQLADWAIRQRQLRWQGRLSADRIQRLDALDFYWGPQVTEWEVMFACLVPFKERFGHCKVPPEWPEDPHLATWVSTQRKLRREGGLSADRIQQLDALDFYWGRQVTEWEEMYASLVPFKERFGHCKVPLDWPEDPELANWVCWQRQLRNSGRLSADRIQQLDALGFDWDTRGTAWEAIFVRLVLFQERFDHCNVPPAWPEDLELANWVVWQRLLKKHNWLSADQISKLDDLGFEWGPHGTSWEEMFARLLPFKDRFGHCNVPPEWPEDPELAAWVHTQRHLRRQKRLSVDRIIPLDDLGFEWDPDEPERQGRY
jgi:hypothetical protein